MRPVRRLPVIDALRGISALVVVLHHVATLFPATWSDLAASSPLVSAPAVFVARRSTEAVLLFFVLSGFSIRLSVEGRPLRDAAGVRDYLRRRARRIGPPYLLALAVAAFVAGTVAPVPAEALSLSTLAGNLLFLQTPNGVRGQWFLPYGGNAPLWSLSFEMFYYLSYPLLVLAVAGPTRRLLVVLGCSALGFAAGELAPNPFAMFCAAWPIWYFGVELAELQLRGGAMSVPLRGFVALWLLLAVARLGPRGLEFHGVFVGSSLLLLGALLMRQRSRLGVLARAVPPALLQPLVRVGLLSYPLYLLHVPILRACVVVLGDGVVPIATGVGVSLAVAWLVEHGPERVAERELQVA